MLPRLSLVNPTHPEGRIRHTNPWVYKTDAGEGPENRMTNLGDLPAMESVVERQKDRFERRVADKVMRGEQLFSRRRIRSNSNIRSRM